MRFFNTAIARAVVGLLALFGGASDAFAQSPTVEAIKERNFLRCGVSVNLRGFSEPLEDGSWVGFDVDFCRAVSSAIFDDPDRVEYVPLTGSQRFPALQRGDVDMLSRVTTWTFTRDVDLKLSFAGVDYYDGQGFLVSRSSGIRAAIELRNARVCVQRGTTTLLNLRDFSDVNDLNIEIIEVDANNEAFTLFRGRECDAYTSDVSSLAASLALSSDPNFAVVLPDVISKEPLSLVVAEGDDEFLDIVRWVLNAIVFAEELGLTSDNVLEIAGSGDATPEMLRLLGVEGNMGEKLGLDADWAKMIIARIGNYGEIYARHLGPFTKLKLKRNLNRQYYDGGLIYAPPFR
ncbi:MAG: amino acid ABC transporter substrate-binding protein [Pseudomonadota bacterium]